MIMRKTALLLTAALLLSGCATNKEATALVNNNDAPELTATFVESPAPKTSLLSGLNSFFSHLLPRKTPPPPAATSVQWAGEIRMVNIAENFVLIESLSGVAAVPGEKYLAIRNTQETGALRITSLRNPPFLIADIISGDPSPGDKIHLPRPIASLPTASPTPESKPGVFSSFFAKSFPPQNPSSSC
jgi:hypothetical protein